ncbi:MAG: FHA domain-containing protein [Synergistaceae bacterium]|jgi:hypothetical protein|nr:FHA domain-containing protein [Synergistaceae bacterium]
MDLIKRCPACGEENPVSEVICRVCMTNLASVTPQKAGVEDNVEEGGVPGDEKAKRRAVLTFLHSDGRSVSVAEGGEIGRGLAGCEALSHIGTVSRRHARVLRREGAWMIEDLGSTNGTWVNGRRLERETLFPLSAGDTVLLSLSCEMKVAATGDDDPKVIL